MISSALVAGGWLAGALLAVLLAGCWLIEPPPSREPSALVLPGPLAPASVGALADIVPHERGTVHRNPDSVRHKPAGNRQQFAASRVMQ